MAEHDDNLETLVAERDRIVQDAQQYAASEGLSDLGLLQAAVRMALVSVRTALDAERAKNTEALALAEAWRERSHGFSGPPDDMPDEETYYGVSVAAEFERILRGGKD